MVWEQFSGKPRTWDPQYKPTDIKTYITVKDVNSFILTKLLQVSKFQNFEKLAIGYLKID